MGLVQLACHGPPAVQGSPRMCQVRAIHSWLPQHRWARTYILQRHPKPLEANSGLTAIKKKKSDFSELRAEKTLDSFLFLRERKICDRVKYLLSSQKGVAGGRGRWRNFHIRHGLRRRQRARVRVRRLLELRRRPVPA